MTLFYGFFSTEPPPPSTRRELWKTTGDVTACGGCTTTNGAGVNVVIIRRAGPGGGGSGRGNVSLDRQGRKILINFVIKLFRVCVGTRRARVHVPGGVSISFSSPVYTRTVADWSRSTSAAAAARSQNRKKISIKNKSNPDPGPATCCAGGCIVTSKYRRNETALRNGRLCRFLWKR